MGTKGIVASTAALAVLLQEGIGDTIRISLTPEPNGDRTREVVVAQEILQTMGLRAFTPHGDRLPGLRPHHQHLLPGTGRQIQSYLRAQMPLWRVSYPGVENMQVAVMGCVVNGPGESKHANIGISLPGSGEAPVAPVFIDGARSVTLKGDHIAEEFQSIVQRLRRFPLPQSRRRIVHPGSDRCHRPMSNRIASIRGMNDILPHGRGLVGTVRGDRAFLDGRLRLSQPAHADRRAHAAVRARPSAR